MTAATTNEIPKAYNPADAEAHHYARWEAEGCFAPEINRNPDAPVYSIVIPPPNVTGSLHMGHALQHTIMDVLTRWKRMSGYKTLWLPGTDHAGISAQRKVIDILKKEAKTTPQELGREAFVERVWAWKRQSGGEITVQMRREGASVDWSREQFTMDEHLSAVVRDVFVRLYEEGHIYRGPRIVNWCPNDQTVLSDLEVGKTPVGKDKGRLWYLQYPVKGSDRRVTVATTRPETMLGDTAVAVNPDDARFTDLLGATLELPLTGRAIPIIADSYVDAAFGTGKEQSTPYRIFANGAREVVGLDAVVNCRPRFPVVGGLVEDGTLVAQRVSIRRHVGGARRISRRLNDRNPGKVANVWRCHVVPLHAVVARNPDIAVIGAGPQQPGSHR